MKRVVLLVLAALALGGFAAYGTFQVQIQAEERALARFDTTDVLVSTVDIPALTSVADALETGMLKVVKYPTEYLPLESLRDINSPHTSDLAFDPIPAGHLIQAGDFGIQANRGNSLVVPDGFTAIALELSVANRAGGFLQPGSKVAVISSIAGDPNSGGKTSTKILYTGLQVLAVGQNTVRGLSLTQAADDTQNVVTIAVRPNDVAELLNAVESGAITLVLLSQDTQVPLETVTSR